MIKMASGVAAKAGGPRGFMWASMAAVALAALSAFWVCGASVPLIVWLSVNGGALLISAIVCVAACVCEEFDWKDIDRPLVMWALLADWSDGGQPSWLRLILWMLLIPAEIAASAVLRPITLGIRVLLNPMPGGWD